MALFESMLALMLFAVVLLQVARQTALPYPAMLALAGIAVAALPWAPDIAIDPRLALALFIAPALLDSAYDLPPRELRRHWVPLLALAAIAVVLTTAAVAWAGVALTGMPIAAAIALGAFVAPPDAAAATAMLSRFNLPRRTVSVLKGESLLNDAVALLIFAAAVGAARSPGSFSDQLPSLAIAAPGGIIAGIVLGKLYLWLSPRFAGTLGGTLFEFVTTFGVWVIADRLHLSAILAVVAFAMTIARTIPERQSPRDRIHSYAVWETTVFLMNVLAFLLMGLQARAIILRFDTEHIWQALGFAAVVVAVVIVVRLAWVMLYNVVRRRVAERFGGPRAPTVQQGILVSWCGVRGLVTLATALALPPDFPARDLIALSAFAVVVGTLILQGLTLAPLIKWLRFKPEQTLESEVAAARVSLLDAAVDNLKARDGVIARAIREDYETARASVADHGRPDEHEEAKRIRHEAILAQRRKLHELRRAGDIDDDVFHELEQELDWKQLAASPQDDLDMVEG